MRLYPEQFTVDEEYRFEGNMECKEDIVVAITSSNGKGMQIDSYESYSENTVLDLAKRNRHYTTSA